MKKYPKMYAQIEAYYTCIANYWRLDNPEDFIRRATNSIYRFCCKQIRNGQYTEEEIIKDFPAD